MKKTPQIRAKPVTAKPAKAKPVKAKPVNKPDAPRAAVQAKAAAARREDGLLIGSVAAKLVDAILEPGGKTMAELLVESGWGQCRPYLFKSAEKAGVTITVDRSVHPARYVGARPGRT